MKRPLFAFLFLCITLALAGQATHRSGPPEPVGTWVRILSPWHQPDVVADIELSSWANASIIRFCSNGTFLMVDCVLYKNSKAVSIGQSDGLTTYKGEWSVQGEEIKVKYELTYAEIPMVGTDTRDGAKEALVTMKDGKLFFEGNWYEPNNGLLREDNSPDLSCAVPQKAK